MSAINDVYQFILDQGLAGGTTGWTLIRRRMMDGAGVNDQCVIVAEDGGTPPEIRASAGLGDSAMGDVGVMVTVRGKAPDGDSTAAKAAAIHAALHGRMSQALVTSGTVYFRIAALTPAPVFAGFDDQERPIHTISFRLLQLS